MDTPAPTTVAAEAPAPRRFCAPGATAFALTKTISYTGRDFTVTDAAGAAVMQVEAAVLALLKRSLPLDADAARRPVVTVQDSGYLVGTRWAVFRGDSTSRRNLLFTVVNSDISLVVQITRRKTEQLLGFGRNKYTARINPGIDQAFILALTVILDEMH
jgi:uncharacterized protein YxjI